MNFEQFKNLKKGDILSNQKHKHNYIVIKRNGLDTYCVIAKKDGTPSSYRGKALIVNHPLSYRVWEKVINQKKEEE